MFVENGATLTTLPNDLLYEIVAYLAAEDLVALENVSASTRRDHPIDASAD